MPPGSLSCKVLLDIARYSQLEELKLQLVEMNVTAVLYFFKKLVQGCSKLRKIYLRNYYFIRENDKEKFYRLIKMLME